MTIQSGVIEDVVVDEAIETIDFVDLDSLPFDISVFGLTDQDFEEDNVVLSSTLHEGSEENGLSVLSGDEVEDYLSGISETDSDTYNSSGTEDEAMVIEPELPEVGREETYPHHAPSAFNDLKIAEPASYFFKPTPLTNKQIEDVYSAREKQVVHDHSYAATLNRT